jgi:serine/threonine protein kinase
VSLVFGKYEKIRRLAQGGMGEVFLARQTGVLDRLAILKSLRPELVSEREFVDQFLDEARVAATLNHPNIVAIYDVGEWHGTYYIAMEYIAGEDLSKVWYAAAKAGIGLPFQVSVRILMEAALGLDHAHHAKDVRGRPLNIVHRDISPQNIMVRVDGVTKLVDFGIAKAANKASRTQAGMVKGKLQYMSPEQVRGESLDGRSDQFSLGIVLWEMCTGRRLFKADTEVNTLQKILQSPVPRPSQFVPGFPAELEAVILRMLDRDPARRFPALGEAATRLKEYLDRSAVMTGEVGVAAFIQQILGRELEERTRDLTPMESSGSGPAVVRPPEAASPSSSSPATAATSSSSSSSSSSSVADGARKTPAATRRPPPAEPPPSSSSSSVDDHDAPTVVVTAEARPDRRRSDGDERGRSSTRGGTLPDGPSTTPADPPARGRAPGGWIVRRADGSLQRFVDGAALHNELSEGRLTATDQVSTDGRRFVPLGDEPRLAGALAARRSASAAAAPSASALSQPSSPASSQPSSRAEPTVVGPSPHSLPTRTGEGASIDATEPGDQPVPDFFGDDAELPAAAPPGDEASSSAAGTSVPQGEAVDPLAPAPTAAFSLGALPQQMTGQWQIGGDARAAVLGTGIPGPVAPERPRGVSRAASGALVLGLVVVLGAGVLWLLPRSSPVAITDDGERRAGDRPTPAGVPATVGEASSPPPPSPSLAPSPPTGPAAVALPTGPAAPVVPPTSPPVADATTKPTSESAVAVVASEAPAVESFDDVLRKARRAQRKGRSTEAARLFQRALEMKPDDTDAQLGLARAQVALGRSDDAVAGFRAVLGRDAARVDAQFGLGEALRAAGRTTDAVAAFERYLELAPAGPDAEAARSAIDALH